MQHSTFIYTAYAQLFALVCQYVIRPDNAFILELHGRHREHRYRLNTQYFLNLSSYTDSSVKKVVCLCCTSGENIVLQGISTASFKKVVKVVCVTSLAVAFIS